MPFDLKRILKALLFSTSEPLTVRDVQSVITRYHEQEATAASEAEESDEAETPNEPKEDGPEAPPAPVESDKRDESDEGEAVEEIESQASSGEVPSLVTATQLREALEEIRAELDEKGEVFQLIEGHNGYRLVTRAEFAPWVRCLRGEPRPARLSQAALETLAIIAYRQPATRAEIESIRGVSADGAVNKLLERELIEVKGRAELPGRPIQYGVSEKFLDFVGIKSLEELPASDVLSPREIDKWIQEASQERVLSDREVGLPDE